MHKLKPKSVASLLKNKNTVTNQYVEHAFQILQLDLVLKKLLPEPMNLHCQAANINNNTLVIAVDSPAWSSRLRFHTPEILDNLLNEYGYSFTRIKIIVHPIKNLKPDHKDPLPKLSKQSAALLQDTARSINDPQLRETLLRLSRRSDNN